MALEEQAARREEQAARREERRQDWRQVALGARRQEGRQVALKELAAWRKERRQVAQAGRRQEWRQVALGARRQERHQVLLAGWRREWRQFARRVPLERRQERGRLGQKSARPGKNVGGVASLRSSPERKRGGGCRRWQEEKGLVGRWGRSDRGRMGSDDRQGRAGHTKQRARGDRWLPSVRGGRLGAS